MRRGLASRTTGPPAGDSPRRGWRDRKDWNQWVPMPRRARPLAESLFAGWEDALLFRTLATLRVDVPVFTSIDDLLWRGPAENFKRTIERLKAPDLFRRALARNASQTI